MWRIVLLATILGKQCMAEDQSVLELRKTVYALHDIKIMMQDLIDVEQKILERLSTGREQVAGEERVVKEIRGREGQTIILRCRHRSSDVSWSMEPASGEVETIQNQSKKLKVLAGPDTIGLYKCSSGGSVLHTFNLKLET